MAFPNRVATSELSRGPGLAGAADERPNCGVIVASENQGSQFDRFGAGTNDDQRANRCVGCHAVLTPADEFSPGLIRRCGDQ